MTTYKLHIKANTLRARREQVGLRQQDVASLLGFTNPSRICRWEQGLSIPSITNLFNLAVIYRVNPQDLYADLYAGIESSITEKKKKYLNESDVPKKAKELVGLFDSM